MVVVASLALSEALAPILNEILYSLGVASFTKTLCAVTIVIPVSKQMLQTAGSRLNINTDVCHKHSSITLLNYYIPFYLQCQWCCPILEYVDCACFYKV